MVFLLVELRDQVRVEPKHFGDLRDKAIKHEIDKKYGNKVLRHVGLCIGLYSIMDVGDCFIFQGDGSGNFEVHFTIVVFKPRVGEALIGTVNSCSETEGLKGWYKVSLGFFDDVVIPPKNLPKPYHFDKEEQLWVWKFGGADLYIDLNNRIKFIIKEVRFDPLPSRAETAREASLQNDISLSMDLLEKSLELGKVPDDVDSDTEAELQQSGTGPHNDFAAFPVSSSNTQTHFTQAGVPNFAPMFIVGGCRSEGLGLVMWWSS